MARYTDITILNILGIETSTEACSVSLLNHRNVIFSDFALTPRKHTEFLIPMMDSVLSKAGLHKKEISHVAYASGPGAFTGVRIAASTAQGLAIGLSVPLVAISTLAIIAQHTVDTHCVDNIMATLDARMGEAYIGRYVKNKNTGLVELTGQEQLIKLDQLVRPDGDFLCGSGISACREAGFADYTTQLDESILPHATALVKLAKQSIDRGYSVAPSLAPINYIRNKVAEKKSRPVL